MAAASEFLGAVSDEDKAALLASVDLYVAPHTGGESFGIVLVEAMSAGAPVRGQRPARVPAGARRGPRRGRRSAARTPTAWRHVLVLLAADPVARAALSEAGTAQGPGVRLVGRRRARSWPSTRRSRTARTASGPTASRHPLDPPAPRRVRRTATTDGRADLVASPSSPPCWPSPGTSRTPPRGSTGCTPGSRGRCRPSTPSSCAGPRPRSSWPTPAARPGQRPAPRRRGLGVARGARRGPGTNGPG